MPALAFRTTLPRPDDPDILNRMAEATAKGHPIEMAGRMAGLGLTVAQDWVKRGKDDLLLTPEGGELSPHALFALTVKEAEAQLVDVRLTRIDKAGDKGNWAADMTLLERRFPQDFGRRTEVHVQSESIRVNLYGVLPPEAQLALAQRQAELAQLRLQEGKRD